MYRLEFHPAALCERPDIPSLPLPQRTDQSSVTQTNRKTRIARSTSDNVSRGEPTPTTKTGHARRAEGTKRAHLRTSAAGQPLYRRVVAALRAEILSGAHPVGGLLPTEHALCERFEISRHTVREALRELRADGLIASRRGSGSTVINAGASQTYVHDTGSFAELAQYTSAPWDIVSNGLTRITADVAARLDSVPDARWLHIRARRLNERLLGSGDRNTRAAVSDTHAVSVSWTEVFLHPDYAQVARLIGKHPRPVYELIFDLYGQRIGEVEQVIFVRPVRGDVAKHLALADGDLVVHVERLYRLPSGRPINLSINIYPSDQFRFAMKLRSLPR
ncbi:GntR family transcriptional regulator [Chitinasiproducens palmae]|nr:GntR family transcriptional regulator [Chitinasiproducens palmae]